MPIFAGSLDSSWTAEASWGISYSLEDKTFTRDGTQVIAVTPKKDFGTLFLTVRPQATAVYTRPRVLGVSFWLSGGDQPLPNDALAVTVLGSNQYPYWRKDDNSVKLDGRVTNDGPLFSETRLYYLDIRHTIPPKTWVEVTIWLDALVADPSYTYVTGIYVKNDAGFEQKYYVDNVRLLLQR